jgi:hypothetical protein
MQFSAPWRFPSLLTGEKVNTVQHSICGRGIFLLLPWWGKVGTFTMLPLHPMQSVMRDDTAEFHAITIGALGTLSFAPNVHHSV